ncbi:MAG: carboxypeptidase-like regulatory domain-containing protein, partial [Planctomycetota bacterium]|nr:carboxypeptidase-like regulatory domain-containing protein [Planctomycetota bacterium]
MNIKSSLVLLGLCVLGFVAYFFSQSQGDESSDGMQNGISAAESSAESGKEASLVGEGNAPKAGETERQVIPEKAELASQEPEAAPVETKPLHGVFAQLVDDNGQGMEGIEVDIRSIDMEAGFDMRMWESPRVVQATTGEDGRISFEVSADPFVVRIAEPGFVVKEVEFPAGIESGEDLGVWALTRALVLSGQVVGPNGQPVVGAKIIAPQEGGFVVVRNGEPETIAETDGSGRFNIDTLEPGSWRLMVNSPNYPDQVFSGTATNELQQGGLLWTLNDGATMRGRLTGRPAFNTQELVVRMDLAPKIKWETLLGGPSDGFPKLNRRAELQPDGTFAITGLHPETKYRIRVLEKKNQGDGFGGALSLAEEKTIASSEGTVELVWSTKAGLQLTVVDETSLPLEEFTLQADDFEYYGAFEGEGKHPEGRLDVGGIPVSTKPMAIRVESDGYEPFTIESVEFHSGNVTNLGTVRLAPGKLVRIHVVDATTGKSVKGARVSLTSMRKEETTEEESDGILPGMSFDPLGTDTMFQRGKTDAEGMVSLRYMEGTSGTVNASHTRFAKAEVAEVDLTAFRTEPLVVELWKGGELNVLVLDADEQPVKGVKVELKEDTPGEEEGMTFSFNAGPMVDRSGYSKNTNRKGQVKFKRIPAGDYRCTVAWPGSSNGPGVIMIVDDGEDKADEEPDGQAITIQENSTHELTMAAPLRSTLEGTIMENGTPLVGARITVTKAGGPRGFGGMFGAQNQGVRTDRDGNFLLEDLDPGEKVVTVHHDARVMDFTEDIKLVEGKNLYSAELQVTTVSGRVLDVAGQ